MEIYQEQAYDLSSDGGFVLFTSSCDSSFEKNPDNSVTGLLFFFKTVNSAHYTKISHPLFLTHTLYIITKKQHFENHISQGQVCLTE